jgi:hypothetical protein
MLSFDLMALAPLNEPPQQAANESGLFFLPFAALPGQAR